MLSRWTCTRTARSQRTSGTSATSIRRCMPGPTLFFAQAESGNTARGTSSFSETRFQKLLVNFTWWVNRKDPEGTNIFEGGFLGLDNIGVFDRSAPCLPEVRWSRRTERRGWRCSARTCWSRHRTGDGRPSYEDLALKFVQHFFQIAGAMDRVGQTPDEMWDEEDGFFYDVLRLPDGTATRLRIRSMVGLIPLSRWQY